MRKERLFLPWMCVSLLAAAAIAQSDSAGQAKTNAPRFSAGPPASFTSLGFGYGPAGTLISAKTNAPFSATVTAQSDQILTDGTTIHRENQETVMRDSAGRVYRERTLSPRPHAEANSFEMITIIDTVQHVQYVCSTFRKVCTKMAYHQPPGFRRPTAGGPKRPDVVVEDLGPSEISGLEVEGTRVTRTIPEGMMGNDRPMTSTEEMWYSKALDVNVQMKRNDPRMGTHTTTMTAVNPGEPDPKYFQVPEGYRVEERKFPNGMEPAAGGTMIVEVPKAQ
jgi:hypothetical protein